MEEKRNFYTGLMGTIAVHLIVLVVFLTAKIGDVKTKHTEMIEIEFLEEAYKPIEEIIKEEQPQHEAITPLNDRDMSNIVSNVADQMNEEISTEKYLQELMDEMGIEDLDPHHDNSLPDDPTLNNKPKEVKEETKTNFGQTRITYHVPPNRKARYIDRPIYRCQGGGTVVVNISVDQQGNVLQANVKSSTSSEECLREMALQSAQNFLFDRDANAAKKVNGSITYIFVAQ